MSPNVRQFPRSLEQAFGPYARGPVYPMKEKRNYTWHVVLGVVGAVVLGFISIGALK